MAIRKTQTKRKKATPLPRKIRTGVAAAPIQSFFWFADYLRTDVEKKDIADLLRSYIKENYKGVERTLLLSAPEYYYSSEAGTAATIHWKKLGYEWPERWNGIKKIQNYIARTRYAATRKLAEKSDIDDKEIPTKSAMEVVKEKTSEFIAEVESILDDWENRSEYSLYNEMIKSDLNSFSAKHVLNYYIPLQKEIEELVNEKTEDLVEGYNHMPVPTRKKYFAFVQGLVSNAERYVLLKKIGRKPSKPRVKTADKQVTKLTYAKESAEFKVASINPTSIIGASRVYTFNVKSRIITEYVSERTSGFEIRGSTIYGINAERSRSIRLRKPEEQLLIFLTKTPTVIGKLWEALTTKTIDEVSGRVNKDTILLRALDK